ncbi:MAG: hypothetical protein Q9160_005224 [Pyrenula sp. 1 TL-2023]
MTTIKTVTLVGAGGAVGPAILKALIEASFTVQVLARAGSKTTLPSGAKLTEVDFESVPALTAALKGQDALVSTLGAFAFGVQPRIIEAAISAGVKRIIPSEFGSETSNPKTSALPVYRDKVAAQEVLKKAAADGKTSYSIVFNGPLLDWGLMVGFLINTRELSATLYDGGDRPFSATTTASVGKAIVGILKHTSETANRAVYVQDAVVTQNQLIALAKKSGKTGEWTTEVADTAELEGAAFEELGKEQPNPMVWAFNFIKRAVWGQGYGGEFKKTDNEVVGLKEMGEKRQRRNTEMSTYLLTGTSRSLGLATTLHLSTFPSSQVRLILATVRDASPSSIPQLHTLAAKDPRVKIVVLRDVCDEEAVLEAKESVEGVLREEGSEKLGLDVLVNNAGVIDRVERDVETL